VIPALDGSPTLAAERASPALELENVTVELDGHAVLQELSFSVAPGERVVVLGVNGCGKTTLLKLLDGLAFPSAGTIRYSGESLDAAALGRPAFLRRFRSEVALLFQNVDAMLFNPSVADEIAFGPRQLGLPDVDSRVARSAAAFGVARLAGRPPFELSGGEKKRVALAAIFAVGPKLLLLDEATANLDPACAAHLLDVLAGLADVTTVASTHDLTLAPELGSRALLLAPGRRGLLYDGPTAELLRDEPLLVASGLAHSHVHRHGHVRHAHFHFHAVE
jgi:cobalt/nickel transport system ATP-binding protein